MNHNKSNREGDGEKRPAVPVWHYNRPYKCRWVDPSDYETYHQGKAHARRGAMQMVCETGFKRVC